MMSPPSLGGLCRPQTRSLENTPVRPRSLLPLALLALAACGGRSSGSDPVQPNRRGSAQASRDGGAARAAELERRVSRLELQLLERDAAIAELEQRLEEAQAEIVRAMARTPTLASRAEAASGMAEAEVALQSLRSAGAPGEGVQQVQALLRQGSTEFDRQNYGGALYLADQAKTLAASWRARVAGASRGGMRAGETAFSVPVRLRATSRGNVRSGPGTGFSVVYSVDAGALLSGHSYTDEWIRVTDASGRSGWIFRSLVARP
jgi:hypothetical protein